MSVNAIYARSPQPLYIQAAAIFRENIQSRLWAPGAQIPPLDTLMETYGLARSTLRQAFGLLEAEGLISRARGSGTFVNQNLPEKPALLIPKNWRETIDLSNQLGTSSLLEPTEELSLPDDLGMPCEFDRSARFTYLRRVHLSPNDLPFCFSEVYLDAAIYRKHRNRILKSTVAPVLDQFYGDRLSHARQVLNVVEAGSTSAQSLNVPVSSPVAELRRYACIDARVVYFARLEFAFHNVRMEFDLL